MKREYKISEIVSPNIPSFIHYHGCPVPITRRTRDMTEDEIISHLERENTKLKTELNKIKEYLGCDYYESAMELEKFLEGNDK